MTALPLLLENLGAQHPGQMLRRAKNALSKCTQNTSGSWGERAGPAALKKAQPPQQPGPRQTPWSLAHPAAPPAQEAERNVRLSQGASQAHQQDVGPGSQDRRTAGQAVRFTCSYSRDCPHWGGLAPLSSQLPLHKLCSRFLFSLWKLRQIGPCLFSFCVVFLLW